jgi:hypothetical protein
MASTTPTTCPALYAPCAGKCGGEQVTVRRSMRAVRGQRGVKAMALVFGPCSYVLAQGWRGDAAVLSPAEAVRAGLQDCGHPVGFVNLLTGDCTRCK